MYAEKLLGVSQPEEGYTQARIKGMYGTNERTITFKHPIPVYITYQTVFTDDAGHKQVRADVYGLDRDTKSVMHGERRIADVPVARNYNSSSKPVASNGVGNRRYSSRRTDRTTTAGADSAAAAAAVAAAAEQRLGQRRRFLRRQPASAGCGKPQPSHSNETAAVLLRPKRADRSGAISD